MTTFYIMIVLVGIAVILIAVLIAILCSDEKNESSSVHISGGVDIENGQYCDDSIGGYNGLDSSSIVVRRYDCPFVVYIDEIKSGKRFRAELPPETDVVIGRIIPGNNDEFKISVTSSEYVSRNHCALMEYSGAVYIKNLSRFGTYLNGTSVKNIMLVHRGDIIKIGDTELRISELG